MRFLAKESLDQLSPASPRAGVIFRQVPIVIAACVWAVIGVFGIEVAYWAFANESEFGWVIFLYPQFMAMILLSSSLVWLGIARYAKGSPGRYILAGILSPLIGAVVFVFFAWIFGTGNYEFSTQLLIVAFLLAVYFPITWGVSFGAALTCLLIDSKHRPLQASR